MKLKNKIKKITALTMTLSLLSTNIAFADNLNSTQNLSSIKLLVNGEEIKNLPMPPVIYNNYTLVPAREVFENMGAVVEWVPETREVHVLYQDKLIVLVIDNKISKVGGQQVEMTIPPKIISDKTMIPLRFVGESFGFDVNWNEQTRTASVSNSLNTGEEVLPQPTELPTIPNDDSNKPSTPTPTSTTTPTSTPTPTPIPTVTPSPTATVAPTTVPTPQPNNQPIIAPKDVSTKNIADENHAETKITAIELPNINSPDTYTIKASSKISIVKKSFLEGNRLVLDIHNSENALPHAEYAANGSNVSKIRVGQLQLEPEKVTRVVFDLVGGEYSVDISPDRTAISVNFKKNSVKNVTVTHDNPFDYVNLDFEGTPTVNVYPVTNPNRIIIDVHGATMNNTTKKTVNGSFISSYETLQFDSITARVVLNVKSIAAFSIINDNNKATIKLSEPTFKNIMYDGSNNTVTIKKSPSTPLNIKNFKVTDNYNQHNYKIDLGGNYHSLLGFGEYVLGDDHLSSILIDTTGEQTHITLNEKRILAFDITEDANNVYIKALNPKEKYPRILILDAGHGGTDHGAMYGGVSEKDINYDVINRLIELFEHDNTIKAYSTRTTDFKVALEDRVTYANELGDLFVSVHSNAAGTNTKANGIETYYYPHHNDSTIGISSLEAAKVVQQKLISELGAHDRKIQENGYYVVKYTEIPAMLVELGFLSNPDELAKLSTPEYRQAAAQAIYNGVKEIFNKYHPAR